MEAQIDVPTTGTEARPLRLAVLGDERLARLVGDGSERAFAALYQRYHQPLYRYCRSMLRDDADAQDALQSAFAGALVALRRDQRDAPLRPWLYRIAHNEAISLLRRRRPEDAFSEGSGPASASASAQDVAEERARLALLLADLRELPERQRGALVMRELSGLSHEDAALALGISVGAAKQTVFEARRSLAEFSEGRAMACEEICRTVSDGDGRALRSRRVRAHLRDCAGCAAFAAAIPARAADLRALAPPLPGVAAAGLLARIIGGGSGHGSGGAGGAVAATAGKSAGMALATKAVAGAALIATAAVGATAVLHHSPRSTRGASPVHAALAGSGGSLSAGAPGSSGSGGSAAGGHRVRTSTGTRSNRPAGSAGSRHRGSAAARGGSTSRASARSARARAAAQLRRLSRNNLASSPARSRSRSAGGKSERSRTGSGRQGHDRHPGKDHRAKHHDRHRGKDHRAKHHERHVGKDHREKHHERHVGQDHRATPRERHALGTLV
ncbi:MAG: RNA polymerase sigma factor [Actinomycetota bacterium]|nr:RNA polymerase sigma factor [Actinomycetota bacterium]